MLAVNMSLSTGLSLLTARTPLQAASMPSTATPQIGPRVDRVNSGMFSLRAMEAFLNIGGAFDGPVSTKIPEEHRQWLNALGGDTVTVREVKQLEGAEFEQFVRERLKPSEVDFLGFNQALEDGKVKIQRSVDVPELNSHEYVYDLWKDGSHIGGAGRGTINLEFLADQRAKGINQTVGSMDGQEYYLTW